MRDQKESSELIFSAMSNYRKDNNNSMANLLQESLKSPGRPSKILEAYKKSQNENVFTPFTIDQALALSLDCKCTKNQYNTLTQNLRSHGINLTFYLYISN